MKRGEVWTLRDDQYASKARPVIIVQNDEYSDFDSIMRWKVPFAGADSPR